MAGRKPKKHKKAEELQSSEILWYNVLQRCGDERTEKDGRKGW